MPSTSFYTIAPGDTLYAISRRFGMSVDDIKSINGLNSNDLRIGQTIKVYAAGGSQQPYTPPPTVQPPTTNPSRGNNTGGGSWSGSNSGSSNYAATRRQFSVQSRPEGNFNRYTLTVPLLNGRVITASLRDNVTNSIHMVYPRGIMYAGQSNIAIDLYSIQSVGLNPETAAALQYVSTHEGKFDAINSYDKAIFSYGFIQFTGAAAVGGSLNRLLASMKINAPGAFSRVFQKAGIDVSGSTVIVTDDNGRTLQGDQAWLYIQQTLPLYGTFIQAGFEPALVLEQLRMANALYVQPALTAKLPLNIAGTQLSVVLQEIFTSEAFRTIAIALGINQGIGGMSRNIIAPATSQVAVQTGVPDLRQINERTVAETIARNATDERVRNRVRGVLDSGLSFDKAGWG